MLKDQSPDDRDLLIWKWFRGAATTKAEFGDPTTTDDYELCIYDATGLLFSATARADGLCDGEACWRETAKGFMYKSKDFTPDGLQRILLKEGADGKAKVIVKGKGVNLDMPNLTTLVSPVTVQLAKTGLCWGAVYSFPPAIKNDAQQFKDKAD